MVAYLGYLYCSAEGWSILGSVLSQIQVSWNMGYLEGMKWMEWMASHLNLFELHNFATWNGEWASLFLFSSSLFFKEDNPTLLCWNILNFFGVLDGKLNGMSLWSMRWWLRGSIAGKSGCQYPEWVTDMPAMSGLANGGFCGIKTCRWQVPFPKWMHHSTKLKVTSDSSKNSLCNIRLWMGHFNHGKPSPKF